MGGGDASWKLGRLQKESEASKMVYNVFFKRNSSYVTTIFAVAIIGGVVYDKVIDSAWNSYNKGKLFKDLKLTLKSDE